MGKNKRRNGGRNTGSKGANPDETTLLFDPRVSTESRLYGLHCLEGSDPTQKLLSKIPITSKTKGVLVYAGNDGTGYYVPTKQRDSIDTDILHDEHLQEAFELEITDAAELLTRHLTEDTLAHTPDPYLDMYHSFTASSRTLDYAAEHCNTLTDSLERIAAEGDMHFEMESTGPSMAVAMRAHYFLLEILVSTAIDQDDKSKFDEYLSNLREFSEDRISFVQEQSDKFNLTPKDLEIIADITTRSTRLIGGAEEAYTLMREYEELAMEIMVDIEGAKTDMGESITEAQTIMSAMCKRANTPFGQLADNPLREGEYSSTDTFATLLRAAEGTKLKDPSEGSPFRKAWMDYTDSTMEAYTSLMDHYGRYISTGLFEKITALNELRARISDSFDHERIFHRSDAEACPNPYSFFRHNDDRETIPFIQYANPDLPHPGKTKDLSVRRATFADLPTLLLAAVEQEILAINAVSKSADILQVSLAKGHIYTVISDDNQEIVGFYDIDPDPLFMRGGNVDRSYARNSVLVRHTHAYDFANLNSKVLAEILPPAIRAAGKRKLRNILVYQLPGVSEEDMAKSRFVKTQSTGKSGVPVYRLNLNGK